MVGFSLGDGEGTLEAFWQGRPGEAINLYSHEYPPRPLQELGSSVPGLHARPTPPPEDGASCGAGWGPGTGSTWWLFLTLGRVLPM